MSVVDSVFVAVSETPSQVATWLVHAKGGAALVDAQCGLAFPACADRDGCVPKLGECFAGAASSWCRPSTRRRGASP
jgi:hypothetical protein